MLIRHDRVARVAIAKINRAMAAGRTSIDMITDNYKKVMYLLLTLEGEAKEAWMKPFEDKGYKFTISCLNDLTNPETLINHHYRISWAKE